MLPLFIFGTLLVTAFAVGTIFSVVVQKRRQMRMRLEQQRAAFDYQQALLRTRAEVQEATSTAISRELHDNVNSNLTAGVMQMRAAARYVQDEAGQALLEEAKELVRSSIAHIRTLSHNLNTGFVADSSLVEAIEREFARICAFSSLNCSIINEADHEPGPEARLVLFRVVQEALQNVLKHANASSIKITIKSTPEHYSLSIGDDGRGFDPTDAGSSLGLRNMRERASLIKGSFDVDTAVGRGTTITLQIPADAG